MLENFPADYLRSLTYWIVGIFFPVSFGFVINSGIGIIRRKYFHLRKIANRTKCNSFFDIQKRIPDPRYTRLKFLADMSYACQHRSTAVILLLNIYRLKAKCRCKLGNWESIWNFVRKRNLRGSIHVNHLQAPCGAFLRWDLSWHELVNVTNSYVNSTRFFISTCSTCGFQYGSTQELKIICWG
jgi:hypothetical protein